LIDQESSGDHDLPLMRGLRSIADHVLQNVGDESAHLTRDHDGGKAEGDDGSERKPVGGSEATCKTATA
jgi:hypothetical protein